MAENDAANGAEGAPDEGVENGGGKPDTKPAEGGSGDGSEGDGKDAWTPPTKEEHDKIVSTMAARKTEINRLKAELRTAKEEKDKPDPAAEADLRAKRSATRSALETAGLTKDGAKDALKILNLNVMEMDEDGDVDAADLLALIRSAFAPLFKTEGKTTPARSLSGKKPAKTDDGQLSSARRLLNSAGY